MGRKKQRPELDEALGYPSKRKTKTDRAIAEADRLAKMLADAPATSSDRFAPPALINDPRLKGAMQVWNDYAPRLSKIHLLSDLDRHTFAIFCVYMGEFVAANEDILVKGYSVSVATISGDAMPRLNPSVGRRERAINVIMELSKRFGLTPQDRFALFKDQAAAPQGLFDQRGSQSPEKPAPTEPAASEIVGTLDRFDSPPPGQRPN